MRLRYRFQGNDLLYKTPLKPPPATYPFILQFALGQSDSANHNVAIEIVAGNQVVTDYMVTEQPIQPNFNDPNWSPTPPTEFVF